MIYTSSIYWSSPYPRPLNYPRVLAEQFIESDSVVTHFPELSKLYFENKKALPKGYSFGWSCVKPAPSVRSDAFRAAIRLRNLKAKVLKRYPLFAEQFFSNELESRPDYFSGSLDAETVQFRVEINADYDKAKKLAESGAVVVYLKWWNCEPVFQEIHNLLYNQVSRSIYRHSRNNSVCLSCCGLLPLNSLKQFLNCLSNTEKIWQSLKTHCLGFIK